MNEKNSEIVAQLPRCGKVLASPKAPGSGLKALDPDFEANRHLVCMLRMAASACQLVPDVFVCIPSSERSSAKSPFQQANAA
jgi:hypothetical protein